MHLGVPTGGGSKSFNEGHPIFFDFEERIKGFVNEGAQEQGISTDVAADASLMTGSESTSAEAQPSSARP